MDANKIQAAHKAVLAFTGGELSARIHSFLDWAEHALSGSWPGKDAAGTQAAEQATLRWLKAHRARLATALHERVVMALTGQLARKRSIDSANLELLEDSALAVVMIRARLVNDIMERARGEVVMLESRLDALKQSGQAIAPKALTPGAIADGFIAVMNEMGAPAEVQATLLEAYRGRGVERFAEFYQAINQLLVSYGVLPNYRIHDLKSHYTAREVTTTQLARILDNKFEKMQSMLDKLPMQDWRPGVLHEMFETGPRIDLTPAQAQSFDHVEAMTLDFLRDARISMRIRGEMGRLVLPLIAARLADPDQFAANDNPTRTFMRQLAQLGYRDNERPLGEFESIRIIVGRIVAEHGQELRSFQTGAAALYTIAKKEVRARLARPADATEEALHVSDRSGKPLTRAEEARTEVLVELREQLAGLEVPDAIERFVLRLLGPWMMVRYLRYGEHSPPWIEARTFAAILFDVMRPAVSKADHLRKCSTRLYALEQMRLRTQRSKMPPEEAGEILAKVEAYFRLLDANPVSGIAEPAGAASAGTRFLDALPLMDDPPSAARSRG